MERARDAWLKAGNEERLRRASCARNRPLARFRAGDEVDFWRRGTGKGTRPHVKGKFHGGVVVLASSAEIDKEDGPRQTAEGHMDHSRGDFAQVCTCAIEVLERTGTTFGEHRTCTKIAVCSRRFRRMAAPRPVWRLADECSTKRRRGTSRSRGLGRCLPHRLPGCMRHDKWKEKWRCM